MADLKISALTASTTPLAGTEVLPIVQGGVTTKVAVSDLTAGRAVTASSVNKVAITAPATASTLTIADGKTLAVNDNATLGTGGLTLGNSGGFTAAASKVLTASNTLTLAGTDATTQTFPTTSATIARTDAAQTFTGDQTLATGNLVIGTAGKGIDFSATSGTGTSELLADYEEGTHTTTAYANTTLDNSYKAFKYTKVGDVVTVVGLLQITGSSGSDVLTFTLPFTAAADQTNGQNRSVGGCLPYFVTTGTGGMVPFIQNNTAIMNLYKISLGVATNSGYAVATNADVINGSSINFNITYLST